ncbi:MAG TPA: TrpB-like pyridoxal phosphate-dependent enzyme [Clostridiaceae bacterium]|nr:TrpB-like pyridoxal phosphate-dependent enzyme [Clostridiaceae bacterium]
MKTIPYKTYLSEDEMPRAYYNLRADLEKDHSPLLHPITREPATLTDLEAIFSSELAAQELNNTDRYLPIPQEVLNFYRMYRPSPLVRAYYLEKELQTPAEIYYKYEGGNTSGSHKLNSAIAQAYYAKEQGLTGITTETGAGQWGTALAMACSYFDLKLKVYMVRCSVEQKPHRKVLMETYGATVIPSPSHTTEAGQSFLERDPDSPGSLGMAIAEALEVAAADPDYRYTLGSVLNQVLLHQSIVGLETKAALDNLQKEADILIGCAGGGSNLGGLIGCFIGDKIQGKKAPRIIAVEPASCPTLTRGKFAYDYCDSARKTPLAKMYTLGASFVPPAGHAGGLRFHGMSPIISQLYHDGLIEEARNYGQKDIFAAAVFFARCEGTLPAPESAHAIRAAIDEALKCKAKREKKIIVFGLTGNGYFDLAAYDAFNKNLLENNSLGDATLAQALKELANLHQ